MNLERTLSIIKPDILKKNQIGKIIDRFEKNGLKIIAIKIITTGILRDKMTTYLHRCFLYVRKRKC